MTNVKSLFIIFIFYLSAVQLLMADNIHMPTKLAIKYERMTPLG
jgi:hypothetical protein